MAQCSQKCRSQAGYAVGQKLHNAIPLHAYPSCHSLRVTKIYRKPLRGFMAGKGLLQGCPTCCRPLHMAMLACRRCLCSKSKEWRLNPCTAMLSLAKAQ